MRPRFRPRAALLAIACAIAVPTLAERAASASGLDPKTGAIVFSTDAVKTWSFESGSELAGKAALVRFEGSTWNPRIELDPITDAAQVGERLTDPVDAVEGGHGFRVGYLATGGSVGLALLDEPFFASVASKRIEVTLWARADGTAPVVNVQYAKPEWSTGGSSFAVAGAMRTGRETSDGWVEYSTGPIDGAVWGVPIRAIVLTTSSAAPKGTSYVADAVEARVVPGSQTSAVACTQADVETTCGPGGDCMFGHCVASAVTWGPLPSGEHRAEFAERWIHMASRLIGDRASSEFGRKTFTPTARELAQYATSSRKFFSGMNRLVTGLRDNHTSFGSPPSSFSTFSPILNYGWSGALHACFGVVEKDLLGGGQGFGVFHAGDKPLTGVALKKGDVLVSIDGQDPKAWADAVIPTIYRTATNDPDADLGQYAELISAAISFRASTVTIARCASATACTGDDKKEITIDVAGKVYPAILENGGWPDAIEYFGCSPRFTNAVPEFDEYQPGEDTVTTRTVDGLVSVQFDGFSGQDVWKSKMSAVFDPKPAAVLMDARQGNGGTGDNVQHLLELTRGKSERIGFITVVNGAWQDPSPASLFTTYRDCVGNDEGFSFACFGAWGFFSDLEAPPGAGTKIAWLNTVDVSANDYMPKLLQGRTGFKIFAPHATSGAFGAVTGFSSFLPGWGGGSIQYQDSRFGATYDAFGAARWESGHGVEPDVVVAQKMSDAIAGRDTMLEAARAWLKGAD